MTQVECMNIMKEICDTMFPHNAVVFYKNSQTKKVEWRCIASSNKIDCLVWLNTFVVEYMQQNIPFVAYLDSEQRIDCNYNMAVIEN